MRIEKKRPRSSRRPERRSLFLYSLAIPCFLALFTPFVWAATPDIPLSAREAGFLTQTFSSTFDASEVYLSPGLKRGHKWYPWDFFGSRTSKATIRLNSDRSVTLMGDALHPESNIATIAPNAKSPVGYVGTAFGGGGYFEVTLSFNPDDVLNPANTGWPAFWGLAFEHMFGGDGVSGMPKDYGRFIEVDIFEYDVAERGRHFYGANFHDWYGIYKQTCPQSGFCDAALPYRQVLREAPLTVDFRKDHRFGFLWIPATEKEKGLARFYFDGKPLGEDVTWTFYRDQPGNPDGKSWKFGVLDKQHLVLILGTGLRQPMTVRSVQVWQRSDRENLSYAF